MGTMQYNGVELPALPELVYPYASIAYDKTSKGTYLLYVMESGGYVTRGNTIVRNDAFLPGGVSDAVGQCYELIGSEWVMFDPGEYKTLLLTDGNDLPNGNYVIWTNHDVQTDGGTIYLAASTPIPTDFLRWFSLGQSVRRGVRKEAQWETLFEGTVTTSMSSGLSNRPGAQAKLQSLYNQTFVTSRYRLTVDGIFVEESASASIAAVLGNFWLYKNTYATDDGGDYALVCDGDKQAYGNLFLSRTPGTYFIKLERMVS